MLWREIVSKSSGFLEGRGVPEARVASELLAARLLHIGRGFLAGALDQEVKLPADNNSRRLDLYFKYDLPLGNHKVSFKVKNPDKAHPIEVRSMIIYSDKPEPIQHQ